MATPVPSVARCISRFFYDQNSASLKALRAFIEQIIVFVDAQIVAARAAVAAVEPARILEEFVWSKVELAIETQKSNMLSNLPGPAADICPEFYTYITDPAVALLEGSLAAFLPYKQRYQRFAYATDQFDDLVSYWESAKAQLLAILDVLDDALYNALILESVNLES